MSYTTKRTKTERVVRLVVGMLLALTAGWAFMLAVGVVHHEWIRQCPTIGFWWSVILASLVRSALYTNDWDKESSR